ncbi:MAG: hypothetical protein ACI9UV_001567 [Algoriphagus sp.]|jgi:hypothetical protein
MRELSIEKMEMVNGGMSFKCGMAIAALGIGAVGMGAISGGIGFFAVVAMLDVGLASVAFMTTCGPGDF